MIGESLLLFEIGISERRFVAAGRETRRGNRKNRRARAFVSGSSAATFATSEIRNGQTTPGRKIWRRSALKRVVPKTAAGQGSVSCTLFEKLNGGGSKEERPFVARVSTHGTVSMATTRLPCAYALPYKIKT